MAGTVNTINATLYENLNFNFIAMSPSGAAQQFGRLWSEADTNTP
jgi:hypothetical protein